jgi:ribonuclease E
VDDALKESGLGENGGDARTRRRGRRGGRRRRREDAAEGLPAVAALGAEQPDLPAYVGPTPANPFGFHAYDIFEVIEQHELGYQPGPSPIASPPAPEAHADEASTAEAASVQQPSAAEPTASSEPIGQLAAIQAEATAGGSDTPALAAVAEEVPPEPVQGPAIEPIIIEVESTPPAEKKRGWWRK